MNDVRIILSGLWVALMLTYLLGDVLRIFAGDITPGEIGGRQATQWMWFLIAVLMLIPIAMVVLSPDRAAPPDSLGEHRRSRRPGCVQPSWLALSFCFRQLSDLRWVCVQRADHLVRVVMGLTAPRDSAEWS
jgi:hypothetical protein